MSKFLDLPGLQSVISKMKNLINSQAKDYEITSAYPFFNIYSNNKSGIYRLTGSYNGNVTLYYNGTDSKNMNSSGWKNSIFYITKDSENPDNYSYFFGWGRETSQLDENYGALTLYWGIASQNDPDDKAYCFSYSLENTDNKVTSLLSTATNYEYPSAKAVYNALSTKIDIIDLTGTNHPNICNNAKDNNYFYSQGTTPAVIGGWGEKLKNGIYKVNGVYQHVLSPSETISDAGNNLYYVKYVWVCQEKKLIIPLFYESESYIGNNIPGYLLNGVVYSAREEIVANKVTSLSSSSTNTQYPSAKLLYDKLALKQDKFATTFTQDLLLVNGTPTTLSTGCYYTDGYHIKVNGTTNTVFDNSLIFVDNRWETNEYINIYALKEPSRFYFIQYADYSGEHDYTYEYYTGTVLNNADIMTTLPARDSEAYDRRVPSARLLRNQLLTKEDVSNKVTSLSSSSTNTQYPSAKAVYDEINTKISSVYKAKGTCTFANKPALQASNEGFVYNISDAFTTTADFVEGAGKSYPAGTNIVVINNGTTSSPSWKYDVLAGTTDLSGYVQKTGDTMTGNLVTPGLSVGRGLTNIGGHQIVGGHYNIADTQVPGGAGNNLALIIGNGGGDKDKSNAHTLDWTGNAWFAGDVYVHSTSGTNKDAGSKKLATEEYVEANGGKINSISLNGTPQTIDANKNVDLLTPMIFYGETEPTSTFTAPAGSLYCVYE